MGWKGFSRLQVLGKVRAAGSLSVSTLRCLLSSTYQPAFLTVSHRLTWTILRERRFHCEGLNCRSEEGQPLRTGRPEELSTRAQACCPSLPVARCLCTAAPATLPQCHPDLQLLPPWHQALEAVQWEEVDTRETSGADRQSR